jgi:hypothetical protein
MEVENDFNAKIDAGICLIHRKKSYEVQINPLQFL